MVSPWLRKLVLAAALAVMPLQGIAAGVMATLPCHGDAQSHAMHDGGGQTDDSGPARHRDDAGTGQTHSCCHSTATAASAVLLPPALPDSPVRTLTADSPHDPFVPEQPQRPPLA